MLIIGCAAVIGTNQDTPVENKEEDAGVEEVVESEEEAPAKQAPAKQDETDTILVRVGGTPGLSFSGSYGTLDGQRSVDGVTPQEYEVEVDTGVMSFDSITASMQKRAQDQSELTVEIVEDGEVVAAQTTTAQFGVVSTTYAPGQQ